MAVKIIKNGELPMIGKKCERCGCEFKFDLREVESLGGSAYDYFNAHIVNCPYCGMGIFLEDVERQILGLIKIKSENGAE